MDFSLILCGEKNFYRTAIFSKKTHDFQKKIVDFCAKAIPYRAKRGKER